MRKPMTLLVSGLVASLGVGAVQAADPGQPPGPSAPTVVREIYVPFSELNVLLEGQPHRVMLTRTEYEELLAKAKKSPEERAPLAAALIAADTQATVGEDRAELTTTLVAEVLEEGLCALPLELGGVGLRAATLDGRPAAIGRLGGETPTLFVEGKGRHTLVLEMVAPLQTTAASQVLSMRLPRPPAARMHLTVPGDVEVKSGAEVALRAVDEAARVTRFELVPRRGDTTLVMTLNSHLLRRERVVMAHSVLVYEITQAYERLHATVSLEILHRAVDGFRFAVPEGFEVTEVGSPLMARWNIVPDGPRRVLEVKLREPSTETVVLNISAVRTPARLDAWTAPRLEPLDVVGQVAVVGLLVEDRLQARALEPKGLIRINTDIPAREAVPQSLLRPAPGTPLLRPVVAYYAPQGAFELAGQFGKLPAEVAVTTNLLLILGDQRQEVVGGFALLPAVEKLFSVDFSVPAGWHVEAVTSADEKPLEFERYTTTAGAGRIHVRLPSGVAPGQEYSVRVHARSTPDGWLGNWQTFKVAFPVFALAGAARDAGAVAVAAKDDITVNLEAHQRLVPLDENEKGRFGLGGVPTNLAYRYEGQPYGAALVARRTPPRLSARTFSFLQVAPDALTAHYEVIYTIEEARAQQLALLLPGDTPTALSIHALDGVKLKEYDSKKVGDTTRWNVLLAEPRRGTVRLAVDFQKSLAVEKAKQVVLPLVRAADAGGDDPAGVAYQSGLAAVEGDAELDVQVVTDARRVDVGELVDAEYQPGRRLLGAYGFAGKPPEVKVTVARQPSHALYPAIVQSAELTTLLSADGVSQTLAEFALRTKALFLEIELPEDSTLWSAELDGTPVKPQRQGQSVLVSLPATGAEALRRLQIVYQTPVGRVALSGRLELPAPQLALRTEAGARAEKVPLADLKWHVHLPSGYEVIRSTGTVVPERLDHPEPAAVYVAGAVYYLAGGTPGPSYLVPAGHENWRDVTMKKSETKSETIVGMGREMGPPQAELPLDEASYGESTEANMRADEDRTAEKPLIQALLDKEAAKPEEKKTEEKEEKKEEPKTDAPPATSTVTRPSVAPAPVQTPPTTKEPAPTTPAKDWEYYAKDLEGVRSLKIELRQQGEQGGRVVTFQSLGEEPVLAITLANRPGLDRLGWTLALAVALVGVVLTRRSVSTKTRYVLAVAAIAALVPVVPGCTVTAGPANMAFFAAALLVPYYLLAAVVRWLARVVCRACGRVCPCRATAATGAAVLLLACMVLDGLAAEPPKVSIGPYEIQLVAPVAPVTVPDDAVVLPYDPDSATGVRDAKQILVPYAKYVELWNRAYPDKKLETKAPPAPYALAGASYTTRLAGEEYLLVEGRLAIDVYADRYVTVPLGLEGGVLARAELDGKAAQISVPQVAPVGPLANAPAQQQAQQAAPQAPPPGQFVVLQVTGKGRHELALSVRLRLERQGGWRVAAGVLPAAPAAALAITVPEAPTEVRLSRVDDRLSYDTQRAGQVIETALGAGGAVAVQWRPKVSEGQVDRSLTAASDATLDVQEDGLRMVWKLDLRFPRSQRERFSVSVPKEYLVEKVEGGNVRGWNVRGDAKGQTVEVSLLKAAKDGESLVVQLWRQGPVGTGGLEAFDVPVVTVPDAALQNGQVTIRRSPVLDVRVQESSGVTRTDTAAAPGDAPQQEKAALAETSVLRPVPFQAYRFVGVPFRIALTAAPVEARTTAEVQTLLKIADYEQDLESQVRLDVAGRPIYRVEVFLPAGLVREEVTAPGRFQWAVTEVEKRRLLTVYLADGQQGQVALLVRGKLEGQRKENQVPLPVLEVRDVARQQGDIAVQVDPAVSVEARDLSGCESVLLERVSGWLNPQQRSITQLAVRYRQPNYRGILVLSLREPEVACITVSNVRVTSRTVEETVFLDFTIRKAGIRELVFLLPAEMADARIRVPGLRQKTVEPAAGAAGMVRVRVELQDEIMDQLRVVVQNDRLLEQKRDYTAPIPVVQTGRTDRQFVTMQSSGRDEVVPGKPEGLEPLGRPQKDWKTLEGYGLGGITQAYVVVPGAARPKLSFHTRPREVVRTAGASIGLAETDLAMDAEGAYRAEQVYHVDNSTEQFLEIALPPNSRLWTAWVAGQPVKPVDVPQGTTALAPGWVHVRIPLVKTAPGDLDYEVRVQYAGKLERPRDLRRTDFPLVRTVNINVQRSQVRLHLPETSRWFDFRGTMGRVEQAAELAAEQVDYQTKQAERLVQVLRGSDEFAQVRAGANLRQLGLATQGLQDDYSGVNAEDATLQAELSKNAGVMRQAEQELHKIEEAAPQRADQMDNRYQLNELFERQKGNRARNVVQEAGSNWDAAQLAAKKAPAAGKDMLFNDAWLDRNKLANPIEPSPEVAQPDKPGKPSPGMKPSADESDSRGDRATGGGKGGGAQIQYDGKAGQLQSSAQPQAAQIAGGGLKWQLEDVQRDQPAPQKPGDAVVRYQQKLQQQLQQQVPVTLDTMPGMTPGMTTTSRLPPGVHDIRNQQVLQPEAKPAMPGQPAAGVDRGAAAQSEEEGQLGPGTITARTAPPPAGPGGGPVAGLPAGLASLRVELPKRGTVYMFTTPGGEVEITARSVSDETIRGIIRVAVVLAVLLAIGAVFRMGRRGRPDWLIGRTFSTLLIALGVVAILLGFLPVAGLLAVVAGVAIKVYRAVNRRRSEQNPIAAQAG